MEVEDVTDRDSLEAWLEDRPREDAIWIDYRAAMRILPAWASLAPDSYPRKRSLADLQFLRALLATGVGCKYATPEVKTAASRAARAATSATATARVGSRAAIAVARAATTAARAGTARAAANRAAAAAAATNVRATTTAMWQEIKSDRAVLQKGDMLDGAPMWQDTPNPFQPEWEQIRAKWLVDPDYSFWLRWYEAALAGTPPNWPLLHDIAPIPDEDWEKGITHIAGVIAGIELQRAIAATPNGEDIIANPQTGLLQIVAITDLPVDIATYARRKIIRATEVFGANPENQYAALPADLAMLRAVVADAEATPVELFDACASASRRMRARIELGSCPAADKDPLIEDYGTRIRDAGADILANDQQTQNMLTARNSIAGNNAMQEGAADIANLVALIEPLTTGRLTLVLSSDATVSADPKADQEDRKVASIRFGSRVLRIAKIIAAGTAAAIIRTKEVLEAIPVILASPYYKAALQWIFKFLGY